MQIKASTIFSIATRSNARLWSPGVDAPDSQAAADVAFANAAAHNRGTSTAPLGGTVRRQPVNSVPYADGSYRCDCW